MALKAPHRQVDKCSSPRIEDFWISDRQGVEPEQHSSKDLKMCFGQGADEMKKVWLRDVCSSDF